MIVAAIDTGGTKIAGAAVDESGNILYRLSYPNTGRTGPFILDTYEQIVGDLQKKFQISAIGIGTGGRIDPRDGTVIYATSVYKDYIGLSIGTIMTKRCALPAAVDNDCRVAVCGERWKGAAQGYESVFGIILGTGAGGGFIQGGDIVPGAGFGAGEIGHLILYPGGKLCDCGQKGCAEQYISGTALWQAYNCRVGDGAAGDIAGGYRVGDGAAGDIAGGSRVGGMEITSGYEFFQLVSGSDPLAQSILDDFTVDLATCAVSVSNLLSPQAILIGGGLIDTADIWWERFASAYNEYGNAHCRNTVLLKAATGNDAALLGAACIAFERLRGS